VLLLDRGEGAVEVDDEGFGVGRVEAQLSHKTDVLTGVESCTSPLRRFAPRGRETRPKAAGVVAPGPNLPGVPISAWDDMHHGVDQGPGGRTLAGKLPRCRPLRGSISSA